MKNDKAQGQNLVEKNSPASDREVQEVLKSVDRGLAYRILAGYDRLVVYIIAVGFSCFQLYTAAFGLLPVQIQRSVHLTFAFVLIFLLFPMRRNSLSKRIRWYGYLFSGLAALVGLYMSLNYTRLMEAGGDYLTVDYIFAGRWNLAYA